MTDRTITMGDVTVVPEPRRMIACSCRTVPTGPPTGRSRLSDHWPRWLTIRNKSCVIHGLHVAALDAASRQLAATAARAFR